MNQVERDAIHSLLSDLTRDLDPKYIMSALLQHNVMTYDEFQDMTCSSGTTENKAVTVIHRMTHACSFELFLKILRHNNSFNHLADMVTNQVARELEHGFKPTCKEKPARINIFNGRRKLVKAFGHSLKRLIHYGKLTEFQQQVHNVEELWKKCRRNLNYDIEKRAQVADYMFTIIDCQLANLRIQNDKSMYGHSLFDDMLRIIPYTSNPILSTMSYIARQGAAVIIEEPLDAGLAEMMYAKMHSESIVPCKEAGMVYYQEIDIMVRKYEQDTTDQMKQDMLNRCSLALGQFEQEDTPVKEDFTRMLYLRMANIYLGLNVYGQVIKKVRICNEDVMSAQECLKKVKRTWGGMDTRRKMFYYIAKAIVNENINRPDLALVKSKLALELANTGKFNNEKTSIQTLIEKYEYEYAVANEKEVADTLRDIENLNLDGFLDESSS